MNVREEEKRKNSCPGRGFGLAAAAIGVGVGAALYYFFNQRPENPNGEGSTTEDWQCEQPHTLAREDRMKTLREQAFRERSWTLEECSICFEVMLQNQEVMKLQCSHNFHSQCIMPWLQEKQTCPNCRKDA